MNARRKFLKQLGLSGLAAAAFPIVQLSNPSVKEVGGCALCTPDYYGQGPFYTANAPSISNGQLASNSEPGDRLIISGTVYAQDCTTVVPNALLDIWHANDAGAYDNSGYNLRGKINADANGQYSYETILPGKYLNGASYRPRHIHIKTSSPGYDNITTQIYFAGDTDIPGDAAASITSGTYDATDRIISITQNGSTGAWEGSWDIIMNNPALGVLEPSLHVKFGLVTEISPNPVKNRTKIKYSIFRESEVVLSLYNLEGRLIEELVHEKMVPGKYKMQWSPEKNHVSAGIYLISLQVNGLNVHQSKIQIL